MPCYPQCLIPKYFTDINDGKFYQQNFSFEEPKPPTQKQLDTKGGACLLVVVFVFLVLLFLNINGGSKGDQITQLFKIFVPLIVVFGLWAWIDSFSERRVKEEYESQLQMWKKVKADFEAKRKEYLKLKQIQANEELDKELRYEMLIKDLKNTWQAEIAYQGKKGISENFFYQTLKKYYGESVRKDFVIQSFSGSKPYQPDIILHLSKWNLWIDIEIDEPYDNTEYKPIHFIDDEGISCDSYRDEYFLEKRWLVIKFAEEQVIKYPDSCCKYISGILSKHFRINDFEYKFSNIDSVPNIACWTENDAINMVKLKHRRTYLNDDKMLQV